MGWSGMSTIPDDRAAWCRSELGKNYEVLADSMVSGVWYAAVKHLAPEREGRVFAAVFLTKIGKHNGQREFLVKEMDESVGPCESKCPKKILDLLSPLEDPTGSDKYAADWRQRCRDNLNARKTALKLVDGLRVSLPEPLTFGSYGEQQHFTVAILPGRKKSRTAFRGLNGGLFALRPGHKTTLMLTEDFERQVAETARTAVVVEVVLEDERELEPMF